MGDIGNLGPDSCGTVINHPGGIFNFFGLVDAGFFEANGSVAAGIDYLYDDCSQTVCCQNTRLAAENKLLISNISCAAICL